MKGLPAACAPSGNPFISYARFHRLIYILLPSGSFHEISLGFAHFNQLFDFLVFGAFVALEQCDKAFLELAQASKAV